MTFAQALCRREDINLTAVDVDNWTALHFASRHGHLDILKFIRKVVIERLGKDAFVKMLNTPNKYGQTSLYIAAAKNKPKAVEFLMALEECDHKIASKAPYTDGYTPLHIAANGGKLEAVKSLLEASRFSKDEKLKMEYLEMKTKYGSKAIDLARKERKLEVVEVSLNALAFSAFLCFMFCANELIKNIVLKYFYGSLEKY